MTALTQTRRTLAYRQAPSVTVAFLISLGYGLALVALLAGVVALAGLTTPLYPYAPGEPDLQWSFA